MAIAAILWLLLGGIGGLERTVTAGSDAVHTAAASLGKAAAVNADHTRADHDWSPACPNTFATADVPRWTVTLVALGVFAVVAAVAAMFAEQLLPPGRGPPCGFTTARSGKELLTRFCLSRR